VKPGLLPIRFLNPVAFLGGVCFGLGVLIVVYWLICGQARAWPKPLIPDPAVLATHVIVRPEPAPAVVEAIVERPLFLPGRQAQAQSFSGTEDASVEAGSLSDARLVGIASEPEGGVAIISSGGSQFRVRQGEDVDGWTLKRIRNNVAHFVRGDETHDLQLMYRHDQQSAAGAPPGGNHPPQAPSFMPPGAPQAPSFIQPGVPPGGNYPPQAPSFIQPGAPAPGGNPPQPNAGLPQGAEAAYREALMRQGIQPPP
jgi:hypothetical protein